MAELPPPGAQSAPPPPPPPVAAGAPPSPASPYGTTPSGPAVGLEPSPKKSRSGLYIALALIAVVVVAVGAVFAFRSGDDSGSDSAPAERDDPDAGGPADDSDDSGGGGALGTGAFSLDAAVEQASASSAVEYDMSMSMGSFGSMEMSGGIDTAAQVMTMRMDLGALLGGAPGGADAPEGIDVILDVGNGVMYMGADGFGAAFPSDTPWISMDLEMIAAQSGMSLEEFQSQFGANPLDAANLFADAEERVDLGMEEIDGEPVRHYQVTVDFAAALEANPQLEAQVDESLQDVPEFVVYDVWVTEDNQLRRMAFDLPMLGETMSMEMNMRSIGGALDVQIPPPDQVTDLMEMIPGG